MSKDPGASQTEVGRPKKSLNETARLRARPPGKWSGCLTCGSGRVLGWYGVVPSHLAITRQAVVRSKKPSEVRVPWGCEMAIGWIDIVLMVV